MNKYCAYTGGNPLKFLQERWLRLDPDFAVILHNDSAVHAFMHSLGAARYKAYRAIPNGAIRADFWRVAYLHAHGGVYADVDVEPLASLRSFVRPSDAFVTSGSLYINKLNFHIIIARPGEPILARTLEHQARAIRTTRYSYWAWSGCASMWHAPASCRSGW